MVEGSNKFKDLFCEEGNDLLNVLSKELLYLEQDPNNIERYTTLMRAAHTLKGGAATMGYNNLAKLAHALEDVFHLGERKVIILNQDSVSIALSAVDRMRESIISIREKDTELDIQEEINSLLIINSVVNEGSKLIDNKQQPSLEKPVIPVFSSVLPMSVKVDVERLDSLMGLFEEMLMLRLKLDLLLEPAISITKNITDHQLKERLYFIKEFETIFSQLARLLSETQGQLLHIRLVPIELIFSQFPRMVRDLSLRENKKIEFRIEGGDVELDRTVLSGLGGSLAHLLRNAIDHGIKESGIITLSARRMNDRVHVSVKDDGVGINYEQVKRVAVERGIVSNEAASRLHKQEVTELLFHPNMSTNIEVTEISGRGVGLSAVHSFARELGGHLSVISPMKSGTGTEFILDLPISLATVKVLLVESSKFTFALPFSAVVKTLSIPSSQISKSAHQEMAEVDGELVPVLYLNKLLDITFADIFSEAKAVKHNTLAVLLRVENEKVLIAIDSSLGEQELLIKSLPPILRNVRGFSGSALLPDGRTILLLDAHSLLLGTLGDILGDTKPTI